MGAGFGVGSLPRTGAGGLVGRFFASLGCFAFQKALTVAHARSEVVKRPLGESLDFFPGCIFRTFM